MGNLNHQPWPASPRSGAPASNYPGGARARKRQCGYCRKFLDSHVRRCPNCREDLPEIHAVDSRGTTQEGGKVRQGLLYMLLAAVLYYFAGGYNPMEFPLTVIPPLLDVCLPLLFLSGLGLTLCALLRGN